MARSLLALLLLALSVGPVDAAPRCIAEGDVVRDVASGQPSATVERLAGERAQAFVDRLNAEPPRTDYLAEVVLIFAAPEVRVRLVAFFSGSCLTHYGRFSAEAVQRLGAGA